MELNTQRKPLWHMKNAWIKKHKKHLWEGFITQIVLTARTVSARHVKYRHYIFFFFKQKTYLIKSSATGLSFAFSMPKAAQD